MNGGPAERLAAVRARMESAAKRAGRDPSAIALVAVAKGQPAAAVAEVARAGVRRIGENRVQEALPKIQQVQELFAQDLEWHLIGSLQRNKAARAVQAFAWIHSVDRVELALALERAAAAAGRRVPVLAQVNVDAEPQKGGALEADLPKLVACLDACPHLELRGLMAVPRACEDPEGVRPSFARLRALLEQANEGRPPEARLGELSMGMSGDFEVAIEEGATLVRIGTAIFGPREDARSSWQGRRSCA